MIPLSHDWHIDAHGAETLVLVLVVILLVVLILHFWPR